MRTVVYSLRVANRESRRPNVVGRRHRCVDDTTTMQPARSCCSTSAPTTNVTATFSEDMLASSINATTFKLSKKDSSTKIAATVSYGAAADTATLDP
jgi:Big-like domain-containing protein